MKITTKEEAFGIVETDELGMSFEAIKYLRDYGKDEEILKKVIESLESKGYSNTCLSYAIVAEGHLDLALADPIIGLYTSEIDVGDFMNEQGHYVLGKLMREIGDEVVEKCLTEIFRLHEIGSPASYHFLFDSLMFADLDKYDAQISKMLEKRDSNWAFALYGDLGHPRFKRYLPKLKELCNFYKENAENRKYTTSIIEIEEAIKNIELGDDFIEYENKFYSEYRKDWETHYRSYIEDDEVEYNTVLDKLWSKIEEEDIEEIADEVLQALNHEIHQEFGEEEDLNFFIHEFSSNLEFAKMYDKLEELARVVKKCYPKVYESDGEIIEDSLFKYYYFKGEREKSLELLDDGIKAFEYDEYEILNKLVFYACNGFSDKVYEFIEREYVSVLENLDFEEGTIVQIRFFQLSIILQNLYLSEDNKKDISLKEVDKAKIKQLNFIIDPIFNKCVELGLKDDSVETIENLFSKYHKGVAFYESTTILKFRFWIKMLEVGCPFLVTSYIWGRIYFYCRSYNDKSKNWRDYFKLNKDYEDFIIDQIRFHSTFKIEGPLLVWGTDYFLEFLLEYKIIDKNRYLAQRKILEGIKERYMNAYSTDLWEFDFIHKWKAPKGMDLEDWQAEEERFMASFDLKSENIIFKDLDLDEIVNRIANKKLIKPEKPIGRVLVESEKKIGRNEKVSVEYSDGRVVNDVKYKKVEKDLENGDCELV